jgi:hypothetical protein
METTTDEPLANPQDHIEAGAWIGRQQAFAAIEGKCSAARAQCLREIRGTRAYKKLGLTWDEFCSQHAGISRSHADELIRNLEEFGEIYHRLCDIARISPEFYRRIADRINQETIELDGQHVPITPQNVAKIRAGIQNLRREIDGLRTRRTSRLGQLANQLNDCVHDFEAAARSFHEFNERETLNSLVQSALQRFGEISHSIGRAA